MKFLIVSEVTHLIDKQGLVGAYAPYVREMNLWGNHVSEITILAPFHFGELTTIDLAFANKNIIKQPVKFLNFTRWPNGIKSIISIPHLVFSLVHAMRKTNHIHLRCPASIGLIACLVQCFFPKKTKTVKYAGNWDPNSKQPISYKLQQYILRSKTLTKNCKVLVYGQWLKEPNHIIPFFTASYSRQQIFKVHPRSLQQTPLKLLYVGNFSINKQPLFSVKALQALLAIGINVKLDMIGEGEELVRVKEYITLKNLTNSVVLHGNLSQLALISFYSSSHFTIFVSHSEGWPKVISESMFWGCVPITSAVSCVPQMVGNGLRGKLVSFSEEEVAEAVLDYLYNPEKYYVASLEGIKWAREYTLEEFEKNILTLLK